MEHELKVLPQFFAALQDGSKTFEVRRDDRDFQVGHNLWLREWSPDTGYADPEGLDWERRTITYVLRGEEAEQFGVQAGYCVLGLSPAWEMALCESELVCLRPDTPYIFRVYPNCARCAEMAKVFQDTFSPLPVGAEAPPSSATPC